MTELLIHDREILTGVLVAHQRLDIEGCLCGWNELGRSHAEHIAAAYEAALSEDRPVLTGSDRRVFEWAADRLRLADEAATKAQLYAAAGTSQHALGQYARHDERATTIREDVRTLTGWPS